MLITKILLSISISTFIAALVVLRKDTRTNICAKSQGVILSIKEKALDTVKYTIEVRNPRGTFILDTYAIHIDRKHKVGEKVSVIMDTLSNGERVVYLLDHNDKPIYDTLMEKITAKLVLTSVFTLGSVSIITLIKMLIGVIF